MSDLRQRARARGVATSYTDAWSHRRRVDDETIVAVLDSLGPAQDPGLCDPVAVSWEGRASAVVLRVPSSSADARAEIEMVLEDGTQDHVTAELSQLAPVAKDGDVVSLEVPLPSDTPVGYHRMCARVGPEEAEVMLIRAPLRAPAPLERVWGVFMPLYALHSERSYGTGDLTDLAALLRWVADLGGGIVATLPLLATFLDDPFEPSPYSPVSRLAWNEAFVDIDPVIERSAAARTVATSPRFREELARLRARPDVDWEAVARLKRSVIERWAPGSPVAPTAYARFRGLLDAQGPQPDPRGPSDDRSVSYHARVQTLAAEQLGALTELKAALLFDLPLGVHPHGYDAWEFPDVFAAGVSGGAPPDNFFTGGQNWAFRPLHPERIRLHSYAYPIACLRHLLTYARVLRVDHVMGLQRLWWVPEGVPADRGTYVRYNAEEMYAVLCLEAQRAGAMVVGEDLGTVPSETRTLMARHGLQRTFVLQEEIDQAAGLRSVPAASIATVNTHDMPTFASWWDGRDIGMRVELGLFDDGQARAEGRRRASLKRALAVTTGVDPAAPAAEALRACLGRLARSRTRGVIAALEDLWGETEPQNVPGTTSGERPNWRSKGKYSLEQMTRDERVTSLLQEMTATRRSDG